MKTILVSLVLCLLLVGCEGVPDPEEGMSDSEYQKELQEDKEKEALDSSGEVSFDISMEELYGDWVLIGVSEDRSGPGLAPSGEFFFKFREDGYMTIGTEGREELKENIVEIPMVYEVAGNKLCSNDGMFQLQFGENCAEVIRLNEGRMSIEIEIPNGDYIIYKHFVKLDD